MDILAPLITALHADGRPRVWSLIITIFGDAVQHRGGRIATLRLQHILERIGIEAGTMRTALSRLAADGWVIRDREGRNSFYRLSPEGEAEFAAATGKIYAAPALNPIEEWSLISGVTPVENGLNLGPNLWLVPATDQSGTPDHLCITGSLTNFPEQFAKRAVTQPHQQAIQALMNDNNAIAPLTLCPLDAMAARILLIHRWRRLILRFPEVPPQLFPSAIRGIHPRKQVAQAYLSLVDPSEAWLSSNDTGLGAMPVSNASFTQRFLEG